MHRPPSAAACGAPDGVPYDPSGSVSPIWGAMLRFTPLMARGTPPRAGRRSLRRLSSTSHPTNRLPVLKHATAVDGAVARKAHRAELADMRLVPRRQSTPFAVHAR